MEESSTIRAFIEEGRQKGLQEGLEEGSQGGEEDHPAPGSDPFWRGRRRSRVQAGRNLGPGTARTARGTTLHRLELGRTAQRGVIQRGPAWSTKQITGHPRACATWVYHPHYYCLIQVDDGTTQTGTAPAVDRGMAADRGDRHRERARADADDAFPAPTSPSCLVGETPPRGQPGGNPGKLAAGRCGPGEVPAHAGDSWGPGGGQGTNRGGDTARSSSREGCVWL